MKILIRLPNWLGDVVMSTAFVNAITEFYPGCHVDVIVKKELYSLALLIPGVSTVHSFSKKEYEGLSGVYRFGKKLRSEKYDLFFNLPSSLSSAVMAWASGAKKRVGFRSEGSFFLLTNTFKKPLNVHRVEEYLSLLQQFSGKVINDKQVKLDFNNPRPPLKNLVLINFNSEASSRRMPLDKAVIIINLLIDTFREVTFSFIGSPKEAGFIDKIIERINNVGRIKNLAGKTDLVTLGNLMSTATAVLTTDSGPAHLANSVGTPTIVLFGAGNEHNTAPYNKQGLTVLRYGKLSCEPCVKNTCKLYGIPKCMELLDEVEIIKALSVYLSHA